MRTWRRNVGVAVEAVESSIAIILLEVDSTDFVPLKGLKNGPIKLKQS